MTLPAQPGILQGVPAVVRYVTFNVTPVNGAFLWCPPVQGGRLNLRRLGL